MPRFGGNTQPKGHGGVKTKPQVQKPRTGDKVVKKGAK